MQYQKFSAFRINKEITILAKAIRSAAIPQNAHPIVQVQEYVTGVHEISKLLYASEREASWITIYMHVEC